MDASVRELVLECSWAGTSSQLSVDSAITIGRAVGSGLVIPLEDVSRQHARIEPTSEGWQLVDLESLNGSHLNGARIATAAALHDGDVIHIGGAPLRVKLRTPPSACSARTSTTSWSRNC